MSKAAQAAAELEQAFVACMPASRKKMASEAAWSDALAKFYKQAREIRARHGLGVFRRARAAYLLQQRLIARGFDVDVVRKVVFALIMTSFAGEK